MNKVFTSLGYFHTEHCRKDSREFYVFDATEWRFLPSEVLCLLKIRVSSGKSVNFISHPVIGVFRRFIKNEFTLSSEKITFEI